MESPQSAPKADSIRRARLTTVESLRANLLPAYFEPVPSTKSVHAWLRRAGVPRFKANLGAKRGGGQVFYSVAAVEKLIRQRTGGAE